jgi:hypothetical protein
MTREGNELVVVGVLVGRDHGLNQGADPFPFRMHSLTEAIDVVAEFGLCIKTRQIGRIGNWFY